jgi:hypothetical protein
MIRTAYIAASLLVAGLASCSRSDQSPRPAESKVAAAMPDAAATPGAQGNATAAPHAAPAPVATLSDTHPNIAGNASAAPATGGMAAAGSINDIDRATPASRSSGQENAAKSP